MRKIEFKWETIKNLLHTKTYRAKVFGGWIVNDICVCGESNKIICQSMVFIPDNNHEWEI